MKKKLIKALSFVFVFVFLFAAIPLYAFAGVTDSGKDIASSDVLADLERFGIDITQYQKDVEADWCRMLNFLEYGFSYYTVASDYGLYVYMWNPSGKPIEKNGKNYIQIALNNSFGEQVKKFSKYGLTYISHSTAQGYENLFYKFRVNNTSGFQNSLEKAMRQYDISGVELQFEGEWNARETGVSAVYSFYGYMSYRGHDNTVRNTLKQSVRDRQTVELDLHGTTWKTSTSDKGVDYAYEVFSVYFAVPNKIIEEYGDKDDITKGLVEVYGEYEEQKINGIVTDNVEAYNLIYPYLGQNYKKNEVGFKFVTRQLGNTMGTSSQSVRYNFNYVSSHIPQDHVSSIAGVYYSDKFSNSVLLTQNEFLEAFRTLYEELGEYYAMPSVDDGRTMGYQTYIVKDTDDWSKSIASYADVSRGFFWEWLAGRGNLVLESKDYGSIKGIQVVTPEAVSSALKDDYISDTLFVDQNDVSALREYVNKSVLKNKTVYLLRFAVCDYYNSPIILQKENKITDTIEGEHYYFEKTIFLDFDVLSLTWEDKYEKRTVIPVVASPIDIFGSITPSTTPSIGGAVIEGVQNAVENVKDTIDNLAKFKAIFLLLAGLLVLALIVWVLGKLGILSALGKLFSGAFRGIGALFGFAEKRVDKYHERKEHNEDRAWKSEEEERKRSEEARKAERHNWDKYDQKQKKKEDGWRNADRERLEKKRKENDERNKNE